MLFFSISIFLMSVLTSTRVLRHVLPCVSSFQPVCMFTSTHVSLSLQLCLHLWPYMHIRIDTHKNIWICIHKVKKRHRHRYRSFVLFAFCRFLALSLLFFVADCAGVGCGRLCYHICVMLCPFFSASARVSYSTFALFSCAFLSLFLSLSGDRVNTSDAEDPMMLQRRTVFT